MKPSDLLSYLPPVLQLVREFQALAQAGDIEADALWEGTAEMTANQFVDTLNLYGVKRWEGMLGIKPLGTDTLEDRRFRIKAWMNHSLPYTIRSLNNMISGLCGADGYTLTLEGFEMTVRLELTVKKQFYEVENLLERVVPANIRLAVQIRYNQYFKLRQRTHAELAAYTHDGIRNEVV